MTVRTRTSNRIRGSIPETEKLARQHRRKMTPQEQVLWNAPKGRKLGGLKFRAQHPVGPFILDFWWPGHSLVVEVDGGIHDQQQQHDETRTQQLREYGCRVICFRNEEIMADLASVLERIQQAALED